jgi:N utilization substance protein B
MYQHQAGGSARPEESVRLFEQNFSPGRDPEAALGLTSEGFESAWPKAKALFLGACARLRDLDRDIGEVASNWTVQRMSPVDLALMRLAWHEMLHGDVPPKVSLNEAIEMAKDFGDLDSTSFVNAILDKLMDRLPPRRRPEGPPK